MMDGKSPDAVDPNNPDFLNSDTGPGARIPDLDIFGPARFFNRELSWLQFNWRVLEAAKNQHLPLLERVMMLSISGSNLDEFYTVRVAGLKEFERGGITTPAIDGMTPKEQLAAIDAEARALLG